MHQEPSPVGALPETEPMAAGHVVAADWQVQGVLGLSAFLAALNFFAPTPFYPQIARDLQTTVPLLGQVITLMALLSALLGLAIGPLTDRYGFQRPLIIGLLAIAVTLAGTGLAQSYAVLLGLGLVGGLGDALVFALPFAIAATRFSGEAQRRVIGLTIGAFSVAPVIGVPLLTALGGVSSWRVSLVAAGLVAAIVAGIVAIVLPADSRRAETPLRPSALLAAYAPLLKHPPILRLFGVSALRGIWWVGLVTYLGAFLGTAVGLGQAQIGLVYALTGGAFALGSVAVSGPLGGISPRLLVALSSTVGGVLVAPMLLVPAARTVIPLLLIASLAAGVCGVSVVALLAAESPAGAGTTMVLNGSILNLGTAGSAALGGALIAVGGYPALGIGLPIFSFLAALLAWWPEAR